MQFYLIPSNVMSCYAMSCHGMVWYTISSHQNTSHCISSNHIKSHHYHIKSHHNQTEIHYIPSNHTTSNNNLSQPNSPNLEVQVPPQHLLLLCGQFPHQTGGSVDSQPGEVRSFRGVKPTKVPFLLLYKEMFSGLLLVFFR